MSSSLPYIAPWALEANFPAGPNPWNGQPCKVPPAGDVFIPNTKPPSENLNYLFHQRDEAFNAMVALAVSAPLQNWSTPKYGANLWPTSQGPSPFYNGQETLPFAVSYDTQNAQWVFVEVVQSPGILALSGTAEITDGSNFVATTASQVGIVQPGSLVSFGPTGGGGPPGYPYLVLQVTSTTLILEENVHNPAGITSGVSLWCASVPTSPAVALCTTADGGKTVNFGLLLGAAGPGVEPIALACGTNTGHNIAFVVTANATNNRQWIDLVTMTIANTATEFQPTTSTVFYLAAASKFVEVSANSSGGSFVGAALSYLPQSPYTPAVLTSTLPAAWQSGSGTIGAFHAATSPTEALVVMQTTAVQDRLLLVTDPGGTITFTDVTPSIVTGLHIYDCAYDAQNSLWGILLSNGKLYTTTDPPSVGSTWVDSGAPTGGVSIAAVGGVWALSVQEALTPVFFRVMLCPNITATSPTWKYSNGATANSTAPLLLVQGPNQIMGITIDDLLTTFSDAVPGLLP